MAATRIVMLATGAALALAGCGGEQREGNAAAPEPRETPAPPATATPAVPGPQWQLTSSGAGATLRLMRGDTRAIELSCPAAAGTLRVNVPSFRAVASEERLSIGSGRTVVALVADTRGDARLGGVTGEGDVPAELATILAGGIGAVYGAQETGAQPPVPAAERRAFLQACGGRGEAAAAPSPGVSACLMQEGARLAAPALVATGTEPFWSARIEGRCVTYSTPEDPAGTRIWTQFRDSGETLSWTGELGGARFELRARRAGAGASPRACSDGMSDRRYPWEVSLGVRGETRRGCAAPPAQPGA